MFPFCCTVTRRGTDSLRSQIYFSPRWSQDKELYQETLWQENLSNDNSIKVAVTESSVNEPNRKQSDTSSVTQWSADEDYQEIPNLELSKKNKTPSWGTVPCNDSETVSIEKSSSYSALPMTKILPNLYLGSYDDAINETQLKAKRITHIVSLIGNQSPVDFVQHKHSPMHDYGRSDLKVVLEKVSKFMRLGQQDGNSVLVHCKCGQNRSATVVVAHLMISTKRTLYCAHNMVKRLRPVIQINERYAKQLLRLEKDIFGKNSLPYDWMELEEVDMTTGDVSYKSENLSSGVQQLMFDSKSL